MFFVMLLGTDFVRTLLVASLFTLSRKVEPRILQIFGGCTTILFVCCWKIFSPFFCLISLFSLSTFHYDLVTLYGPSLVLHVEVAFAVFLLCNDIYFHMRFKAVCRLQF
jgi:hypothetical protein